MAILGSRTNGCPGCCAASGDCKNAPAATSASTTDFFMETSQICPYAISRGVPLMRRNPAVALLLLILSVAALSAQQASSGDRDAMLRGIDARREQYAGVA